MHSMHRWICFSVAHTAHIPVKYILEHINRRRRNVKIRNELNIIMIYVRSISESVRPFNTPQSCNVNSTQRANDILLNALHCTHALFSLVECRCRRTMSMAIIADGIHIGQVAMEAIHLHPAFVRNAHWLVDPLGLSFDVDRLHITALRSGPIQSRSGQCQLKEQGFPLIRFQLASYSQWGIVMNCF